MGNRLWPPQGHGGLVLHLVQAGGAAHGDSLHPVLMQVGE